MMMVPGAAGRRRISLGNLARRRVRKFFYFGLWIRKKALLMKTFNAREIRSITMLVNAIISRAA